MPKAPLLVRTGFTQGVKASLDPSVVPPNALWEARNVRADESGVLRIRRGSEDAGTALGTGIVDGAASAFDGIVLAWNKTLYFLDTDAETYTEIDGSASALAADSPLTFIRWTAGGAEVLYVFGGTGIWETDGSEAALVTPHAPDLGEASNLIRDGEGAHETDSGPARCALAVLRAGLSQRIAAAGDPDSPNTVYLSAPLDASYWPSDQTIQLPDDGSRITALANWYGALIIFRDTDVWAFFGADATEEGASLVLQTPAAGCLAARTLASVPGLGLVFLGNDNVYALQGVTGVENQATVVPLGDDILRFLRHLLATSPDNANAIYWDREYRLCFPETTRPEKIFRLSLLHALGASGGPRWYADTAPATAQFVPHAGSLYAASSGLMIKFTDSLYDSGIAIPYYVAFRRESLQPGPARLKKLYLYVMGVGTAASGEAEWFSGLFDGLLFDESESEDVLDIGGTEQDFTVSLFLDADQLELASKTLAVERMDSPDPLSVEPVRVYELHFVPSKRANFVQVRVNAETAGQDIAVLGYAFGYSARVNQRGRRDGWE
ncbi:MAG: hypothetical protein PHU85_13585 [Phycisphaerae bacterium]|nr:hypothetical protein [Phycisphaerae bacterium]